MSRDNCNTNISFNVLFGLCNVVSYSVGRYYVNLDVEIFGFSSNSSVFFPIVMISTRDIINFFV